MSDRGRSGESQDPTGHANTQIRVAVGEFEDAAGAGDAEDTGEGQKQSGQGFIGMESSDAVNVLGLEPMIIEFFA